MLAVRAIRALSQRATTSSSLVFNRSSYVYFSNAAAKESDPESESQLDEDDEFEESTYVAEGTDPEATNAIDKYAFFDDVHSKSQSVFFKAVGLPENPEEMDENSVFDYLDEHDPLVNDVVLRSTFAYGRAIKDDEVLNLGIQYWQKYTEQTIPSVQEYNEYLLMLGSSNLSDEAWKVFVEMDRDCDRTATTYINFLLFHPLASLKEEQKKFILESFEADRKTYNNDITLEFVDEDAEDEAQAFERETQDMDADEKQDFKELFKDDWDYVKDDLFSGEFFKDWTVENALKLFRETPFYQELDDEDKESYNEELEALEFPNYS